MKRLILFSFFIVWLAAAPLGAAPKAEPGPAPVPENPWRVIYVEGGEYRDFYLSLVGLAHGLKSLGLIQQGSIPVKPDSEDSSPVWQWLAENAGGPYLKFLEDGFYTAGWDETRRTEVKKEILARLERGEVDLILTFGTWAGVDFVTDEHRVPVMSITATDPVAAGISLSETDSGLDHAHVQVEAGKIERQISMFHNIFNFKRLGVPYDSTDVGRKTMGVPTIERMAEERGFVIVPCLADLEIPDLKQSFRNLQNCLTALSQKSDAIYLTVNNGMQPAHMAELLAPIIGAELPSFSQKGPSETRLGVLMSLAEDDFTSSGRFEAEVVEAMLRGRKPRDIKQIYVAPLTMALNLKMCLTIGWNPPFEVLAAVDELYNTIAGQE